MKKHLFTLVLALLLAALASAAAAQEYYTLPEIREQAAQGWHQTYTDKYGRTRQVDVDIEVFGEDVAPVLKACWGTKRLALEGPAGDPQAPILEARVTGKGLTTFLYEDVHFMKVDPDRPYGEDYGNDLTLREVYDFCEELMNGQGKRFYQDYLWEQPAQFSVLYSADKGTGGVRVPAMYSIRFCQKKFGLPILTHVGSSFEHLQTATSFPVCDVEMKDRETYLFGGYDFDVAEVLADDIPLCSVDKVIESARAMIEDGYIQDVRSLRFGYVVYSDPETNWSKRPSSYDVDTWYLVPSWVMECNILWNAKEDNPERANLMEVTVNAQTGEMTDYFDKSLNGSGDVRYKGFVPWEDVE